VELDAFAINRDRVQYDDVRRCEEAGACPGRRHVDEGRHEGELALVTLDLARSYCAWRGMRLPTFLEWQRAARGKYGEAYPPRWPENSHVCPSSFTSTREPFPESCSFTSAEGLRYVMHSFNEWTSDDGCMNAFPPIGNQPIVVKLSESRLDVSMKTSPNDMATFRCVLPIDERPTPK